MQNLIFNQAMLFLGCSFLLSCNTNLMVLENMLPRAKQQSFNVSLAQSSLLEFAVKFDIVYEISNPYKKDPPLPDHAIGIYVNGNDIGLAKTHEAVAVPAKSSTFLYFYAEFRSIATTDGQKQPHHF